MPVACSGARVARLAPARRYSQAPANAVGWLPVSFQHPRFHPALIMRREKERVDLEILVFPASGRSDVLVVVDGGQPHCPRTFLGFQRAGLKQLPFAARTVARNVDNWIHHLMRGEA